ncbi:MAG: hypothetical protein ACRDGN_11835, partial [bacterium]
MRTRALIVVLLGLALVAGILAPAAGGPASGGSIAFPIVGDPTFNPWHPRHFVESIFVTRVLFNGLTKWGKESRWVGDLAERWEVSADALTWT